jgi:hypothetical protein
MFARKVSRALWLLNSESVTEFAEETVVKEVCVELILNKLG